jgi:hypothetical protein
MNTCSARERTLLAPAELLRSFCAADNGSGVTLTPVSQETLGKFITREEQIFISFLHGSTSLLPVEGSCEYGNEPSGSIKCWEVLE